MPLESGSKIGPYVIVEPVPNRGDGHVYKASDSRSNRNVLIRMLLADSTEDAQNRQRLQREAKAIASLNHPNISAVVDVAEQDGEGYVVTEHLEGETLAQRLAKGPMELDEALKIAIAIADALDKAHRSSVIHRGLNPSRILLTSSGVKITGFGLSAATPAVAVSTSSSIKKAGAGPLNTVDDSVSRYISPEQWEGHAPDARSDIFAFGTLLYEMVTGSPAFEGKTQAMLIAAIGTVDPDPVSTKQPMTPPALDYLVERCLEKDPKQRLQTAWDLLSQLQWIDEGSSQIGIPAQTVARTKKRNRAVWISLGVVALLILAMVPLTYRSLKGSPEPDEVRFIVANMGNSAVNGGPPASVSTDGRWIVRSPGGTNGLNAVLLSSVTQQFLLKDYIVTQPFWSPDSKSIGFFQDNTLKVGDVASGQAKTICEAPSQIAGGTWNNDGIILFSSAGSILRVLAAGGQPTAVVEPDKSKEIELLAPFFLPDGHHFLYLSVASDAAQSAIYVASIDSKEKTRLFVSDSRAYYAAPGYILFNKENAVFARPFDAGKLQFTGEPVRLMDGVPLVNSGPNVTQGLSKSASFAVSQTGVLVHRMGGPTNSTTSTAPNTGGVAERVLTWIDRSGGRVGQVGSPAAYAGIDLSPDGKKVAVHVVENNGGDSWFFDSAQGRMQRLTFDASQNNGTPVWNPDGTKIAFSSTRKGKTGLYVKPADGTSKEELIFESELPKVPMSWTPDGKQLVFEQVDPKTHEDIWVVPVTGDKKPVAVLQTEARERFPQVSPDGKWIAYTSNETGPLQVFVKQFPEGPGKWQVSTDGGLVPRWNGNSKELFYLLNANNIMAVDIHVVGGSIQAGAPHMLFGITNPGPNPVIDYLPYAVASDGKRFLVPQTGQGAAISGGGLVDLLATTADQGGQTGATANSLLVIMNWPRLMKRK